MGAASLAGGRLLSVDRQEIEKAEVALADVPGFELKSAGSINSASLRCGQPSAVLCNASARQRLSISERRHLAGNWVCRRIN
jgi:hypothetical protein